MFHARPEPMIRFLVCTSIACLAASCVPPKAILVEAAPAPQPVATNKPLAQPKEEVPDVPQVAQQQKSGMRLRDPAKNLPDSRDFNPTAPTVRNAGSLIVSPPAGSKPAPQPAEDKPASE